ncbi:hypothetical protein PsYK624_085180 [Phanerochaete sordida]|uniref:Uncharacterized protein n=1 Tax=Phanerochaete sordida TaxID=48140 RepID=A0A9P3LF86_9APHY|nr:hypothetical protein PsYK624_085180 [Phanerochaete sordida]
MLIVTLQRASYSLVLGMESRASEPPVACEAFPYTRNSITAWKHTTSPIYEITLLTSHTYR